MWAIVYLGDISQQELVLEGEQAHHLLKVARVREGEKVCLLDGRGEKIEATVQSTQKKSLTLGIGERSKESRKHHLQLLMGLPKKEAFESMFRQAVEIGFEKIFFWSSEYSAGKVPKKERLDSLEESGMIQSNNPFQLSWEETFSLSEVDFSQYKDVFYFSEKGGRSPSECPPLKPEHSHLLLIGPEGGFSLEEEAEINRKIQQQSKLHVFHLPTYILRAPTALSVASGVILGNLLSRDDKKMIK